MASRTYTIAEAAARVALVQFYGDRFTSLPKDRQDALAWDVAEIVKAEPDLAPYALQAVRLLDKRIGTRLLEYSLVIVITYKRRWQRGRFVPGGLI